MSWEEMDRYNQEQYALLKLELNKAKEQNIRLQAVIQQNNLLLRCWQTWLGSSRNHCDDSGVKIWDKIDQACNADELSQLSSLVNGAFISGYDTAIGDIKRKSGFRCLDAANLYLKTAGIIKS